jgi:hypothetical protein
MRIRSWIRIQLKILMRIRIQIRGGRGVGQPKMCIPPIKILGTPLLTRDEFRQPMYPAILLAGFVALTCLPV